MMAVQDIHERFDFTVRSYECAADGRVTVANLCNYLQEAASLNAEHLGFNKSNFDAAGLNITWVMTHLRLKLSAARPKWGEVVEVLTFPRNARRLTAHRDFILSVNGIEVGRATTEWVMIDMTTRRPVAIPEMVLGKANTVREPVLGAEPFSRLKWPSFAAAPTTEGRPSEPAQGTTHQAPGTSLPLAPVLSDTDLNGHVNNTRYIAWCFDAMGSQPEAAFDFELVFRNEMRCGEAGELGSLNVGGATLCRIMAGGTERVLASLRQA